jgi:NADH:ubiquinone oxidoreductase subunit 5 (subunit L)/multisubunit Na+/H+ antiporter MnhA subunit
MYILTLVEMEILKSSVMVAVLSNNYILMFHGYEYTVVDESKLLRIWQQTITIIQNISPASDGYNDRCY